MSEGRKDNSTQPSSLLPFSMFPTCCRKRYTWSQDHRITANIIALSTGMSIMNSHSRTDQVPGQHTFLLAILHVVWTHYKTGPSASPYNGWIHIIKFYTNPSASPTPTTHIPWYDSRTQAIVWHLLIQIPMKQLWCQALELPPGYPLHLQTTGINLRTRI